MENNNQSPYLTVNAQCTACGWCKYNCPVEKCITFETGVAVIDPDLCTACNRCICSCPVDAIQPIREVLPHQKTANEGKSESFDVVVIGAGMGGMLSACQLAQAGKRVLLVEKLSFLGGRFSGFKVENAVISSGALHTVPYGNNGPFAQALRRSGVDPKITNAKVFASFYVNGKHIVARKPIDALKIFPISRNRMSVILGLLRCWWAKDFQGSFRDWMQHIGLSDNVQTYVDRFFQFTLSTTMYDVPYPEGRKVIESIIRYGLPGVPKGGAREITRQLGHAIKNAGVDIRRNTRVQDLIRDNDRVCGVTLLDRRQNMTYTVKAPIIISNMGLSSTLRMWDKLDLSSGNNQRLSLPPPTASGLKIQVLSPKSLIDHNSILFCLDTQRVAGIVQVSNNDTNLSPPGRHLLMSHQTIQQGTDWQEEYQLAIEDWHYVFGNDFYNCQVLGCSHFPAQFPVNWASQGYDLRDQVFSKQGLWLVGDSMKPKGLMMVEGVGANAEMVVRQILGEEDQAPWEITEFAILSRWIKKLIT